MPLPEDFENCVAGLLEITEDIEGYLAEREVRFMTLLAACPTGRGEILEIGSFKGKSTIVLAKGASLTKEATVVAVDPLIPKSTIDPSPEGDDPWFRDFQSNLRNAGVEKQVEFHRMSSAELAETWNRDIKLLWIDGDHTYAAVKSDLEMFRPFLSDGAIVAMHDVLNVFEGPIRVFTEDVLLSSNFGPAGLCGSIGWSQYLKDPESTSKFRRQKARLYRKLNTLIPYSALGKGAGRVPRIWHKILRSRVPHSDVEPVRWLSSVTPEDSQERQGSTP
ncbi:MAG: class I SAM-dependent methyltransferase [Phycisphaerales bacterium]|nr:MAG: class I SAM-dependent methyltransferase [Phycisphaerales bacterium]